MLPIENFSKLMVSISQRRVLPIVQQGNKELLKNAEIVSDICGSQKKAVFNASDSHCVPDLRNFGKFHKGPNFLL